MRRFDMQKGWIEDEPAPAPAPEPVSEVLENEGQEKVAGDSIEPVESVVQPPAPPVEPSPPAPGPVPPPVPPQQKKPIIIKK